MIKIKVSTSATGIVDANHYTYNFLINPMDVDLVDSKDIVQIETLGGSPVFQQSSWDGRTRQLIWQNVGADSTTTPSVRLQVASCRSWLGSVKYFNFGDLDKVNQSWPVVGIWKKARVTDLKTKMKQGLGLRYDSVILEITPEV